MGHRRYFSVADTFITDQHPEQTTTIRLSGSNFGYSPVMSVFARKSDISTGSIELARSLVKFDINHLSQSIFIDKTVPSSSVSYMMKLFDQRHQETVPTSYDLFVYPISQSWDEGRGIDLERGEDEGWANWLSASSTATWVATGSDYISTMSASQHFDAGDEDLLVDITTLVNEWLTGALPNYGVVVKLGTTEESNGVDYYRKSFHTRQSLYVDKVPYLEARWNSVLKDQRENFALDVESTLVMYNYVRGELTNMTDPVVVTVKDSLLPNSASYSSFLTASKYSTGIYTASFTISSTGSHSGTFYDIWTANSLAKVTGSFKPLRLTGSVFDVNDKFTVAFTNLKRVYDRGEEVRLVVGVRKKDFVTHVGLLSTASLSPELQMIEKMYYRVVNVETGEEVIPFGTASDNPYTQLSYDKNGNYFDIDIGSFVPGFKYKFELLLDLNNDKQVVDNDYFFKVR